MARVRQTVVAVVHGQDGGQGATVEVYPYDPASATGHQARELLASWRPQPGELDNPERVSKRLYPLQTAPGNSKAPHERGASGFVTTAREDDIAWARAMSGEANDLICDVDYEYEIGEVLLFDAEIDTDTLRVEWSSAVPHPSTPPHTVQSLTPVQRHDGVIVDPQACRDRIHLVKVREDGTTWPFNEAGQLVVGLSDQEKLDYAGADRSQLPHRGPLLVTVDFGASDGTGARLRAEPADIAIARGTLKELAHDEGVMFRPADLEAVRRAAGSQQVALTDPTGATVGAVYLIDADYDTHRAKGSVIFDGLGASNLSADPTIGQLTVADVDGELKVSTTGPRFAYRGPSAEQPARGSLFIGGGAPSNAPAEPRRFGTTASDGHQVPAQSSRAGLQSGQDAPESTHGGRKALAAVQSRTAGLVRDHGPTIVAATKSKLKDPAVQATLRKSMLTAVEIGLAGKGGSSVKFAKAASAAMRVGDMVATAQANQTVSDPGFSR
ncbi:MAG: hypothetical protein DI630_00555 [Gordonia sp. (in: high G+C Gram-positive bacteria)]|nr:MAG: hypothetical protein DI630_00555 [Gordonia sp. (in: high G+C Gram-positive bacteria)]